MANMFLCPKYSVLFHLSWLCLQKQQHAFSVSFVLANNVWQMVTRTSAGIYTTTCYHFKMVFPRNIRLSQGLQPVWPLSVSCFFPLRSELHCNSLLIPHLASLQSKTWLLTVQQMCGVVYDGVDHWGGQRWGGRGAVNARGAVQWNYFYVLYMSATWHQNKWSRLHS